MSKITLSFMQRFMSELDTAIRNFVVGITGDLSNLQTTDKSSLVNAINEAKSSGTTYKTQTLTAGSTSVTFTNLPTTGNYIFEVSTSVIGLDYVSASQSSGQQTYVYDAQQSDITVYLEIKEVQ